jgi:hypothetical protein
VTDVCEAPLRIGGDLVSDDTENDELDQLIQEYAVIKDRRDALDDMLDVRKERILLVMSETGARKHKCGAGATSFTKRRSFKVHDAKKLASLLPKTQLAALARVTADVYDAAVAEGIKIDKAVTVGQSESLTVKRASTKEANERRSKYINESRKQAEQRIEAIRKQLRA